MQERPLQNKLVLVTGAARRIGRTLALAAAGAGADVIVHYGTAQQEAKQTQTEISALGVQAWSVVADLSQPEEVKRLAHEASKRGVLYGLVNSAAVFERMSLLETTHAAWENHLAVNLTAPFLLSQAFARQIPPNGEGRIVNILDWHTDRPRADHFPYSVSKAALAAMTQALAVALAPNVLVNGLALGAVLPPENGQTAPGLLDRVPAGRWGKLHEVEAALIFLLTSPAYMTGEILHLDGGRNLV